jgi:hypothetical protein
LNGEDKMAKLLGFGCMRLPLLDKDDQTSFDTETLNTDFRQPFMFHQKIHRFCIKTYEHRLSQN